MASGKRSGGRKSASTKHSNLEISLATAFRDSALPGENTGFDDDACMEAVRFVLDAGSQRQGSEARLLLESIATSKESRHLRLAIINDDMPFLVDSVCATIAGFGLGIERLIHPVVGVKRDAKGQLKDILSTSTKADKRESVIYIELERTDAKTRRALQSALDDNLQLQPVRDRCGDVLEIV
ncbi:MAG: hypothetical protein AAGM33_08815, partial [Pseudomonadota bacterium]